MPGSSCLGADAAAVPAGRRRRRRRAYHRWLVDTFGAYADRLLLVGDPGSGVDLDAMLAELRLDRGHGFVATQIPTSRVAVCLRSTTSTSTRTWSLCEELDITVALHAGYGSEQCEFIDKINEIKRDMEAAGRTDCSPSS